MLGQISTLFFMTVVRNKANPFLAFWYHLFVSAHLVNRTQQDIENKLAEAEERRKVSKNKSLLFDYFFFPTRMSLRSAMFHFSFPNEPPSLFLRIEPNRNWRRSECKRHTKM